MTTTTTTTKFTCEPNESKKKLNSVIENLEAQQEYIKKQLDSLKQTINEIRKIQSCPYEYGISTPGQSHYYWEAFDGHIYVPIELTQIPYLDDIHFLQRDPNTGDTRVVDENNELVTQDIIDTPIKNFDNLIIKYKVNHTYTHWSSPNRPLFRSIQK